MDGTPLTFEVFGLFQGVLTMIDRESETVWTHLEGKAIRGPLEGERLTMIPLPQMTWGEWRRAHPNTLVLSPDTPFRDLYRPVRIGVFNQREALYGDERLPSNALVVGVEVGGEFKGYPVDELGRLGGIANDTLAGRPIAVLYDSEAKMGIAYHRTMGGRALHLYREATQGFVLRDKETGSMWNRQGKAVSGALAGASLAFVPSFISEWYGWSAYHPETEVYGADSG